MIAVDKAHLTGKRLYENVSSMVIRFAKNGGREPFPFKLKTVTQAGTTCKKCAWSEARCFGCEIAPGDDYVVLEHLDCLALDWDLESFDAMEENATLQLLKEADSVSEHMDLMQCLSNFTRQELLSGPESMYCSTCDVNRETTQQTKLWRAPDVVVVHLKRFETHYINGINGFEIQTKKLHTLVSFPLEGLDLTPYLAEEGAPCDAMLYDLVGVVNHLGRELNAGHYIAYCRNVGTNKWYVYNDRSCAEIDASSIVSNDAYILFYQRRDATLAPYEDVVIPRPLRFPEWVRRLVASCEAHCAKACHCCVHQQQ